MTQWGLFRQQACVPWFTYTMTNPQTIPARKVRLSSFYRWENQDNERVIFPRSHIGITASLVLRSQYACIPSIRSIILSKECRGQDTGSGSQLLSCLRLWPPTSQSPSPHSELSHTLNRDESYAGGIRGSGCKKWQKSNPASSKLSLRRASENWAKPTEDGELLRPGQHTQGVSIRILDSGLRKLKQNDDIRGKAKKAC